MNETTLIVVLVIAGVLVGTIVGVPIIVNTLGQLREWFQSDVDEWLNGNQTGTQDDYMGFAVTIYFEDGTTDTLEPSSNFVLLPLTVNYNGNPISKVVWSVQVQVTYSGTLTTSSAEGTFQVIADALLAKPVMKSETISRTLGGIDPNTWVAVDTFEMTATEIETFHDPYGTLSPVLRAESTVTLDATFADGTSDARSGSCWSEIMLTIDYSGLGILSLRMNTSPLA